jgi:sulfite exporter TauE/SafE
MTLFWFPLMLGFLGSAHCLGMCGPIVVVTSLRTAAASAATGNPHRRPVLQTVWLQAAFHAGRLLTYGLLGGLAALFTQSARTILTSIDMQSLLMCAYGIILIVFGLALMRIIPLPASWSSLFANPLPGFFHRIPALASPRHPLAMLILGLATGLLPCCLSWSMVVTAAAAESVLEGSLMMVAFGAGTIPALFLAGFSAATLVRWYRKLGERLPGLLLVGIGVYLILEGTGVIE